MAFALSLTGALGAANVGFVFSRFVARDWVRSRMPARLLAYDELLERRGLATVLLLRAIFWMNPFLHGLCGLSRISFWTHLFATTVALAPALALLVWVGGSAIELVRDMPTERAAPWLAGVALAALALWIIRRRAARRAAAAVAPRE